MSWIRNRDGCLCGVRSSTVARWTILFAILTTVYGCTSFAYTNVRRECDPGNPGPQPNCRVPRLSSQAKVSIPGYHGRATFDVRPDRGDQNTLFILALSGGGSRAAYFSTDVMLGLQNALPGVDLLSEVDAISSVSGGSMAAAYYAISTDQPGAANYWTPEKVRGLMRKNYTLRWFGNWFWPDNIAKFWFTAFNRTDIMARTLSKNLYSSAVLRDLKMRDLRSDRPYLILNATNGTDGQFDEPFTFTDNDFSLIGSDVESYSLSRAVMGTAAFPAVFNYMTLRDWSSTEKTTRYIHIFDGGNFDNLGLRSVIKVLDQMEKDGTHYQNLVVILVDAYTEPRGIDASEANPRQASDYIIDKNFLASSDALLHLNRDNILADFKRRLELRYESDPTLKKHTVFYQIQLLDVKNFNNARDNNLGDRLNRIPTNFKIAKEDADDVDTAIAELLTPENDCLQAIKELVRPATQAGEHHLSDPVCRYPGNVPPKGFHGNANGMP